MQRESEDRGVISREIREKSVEIGVTETRKDMVSGKGIGQQCEFKN